MHDKSSPAAQVRMMSNMRLESTPQGACEVVGVLNNEFLFRLPLAIQENDESVSLGEMHIESLPQDQPAK